MNRRDLLRLGLTASAGGVAAGVVVRPHDARVTGDEKDLPPVGRTPADVAARLAKLRARSRHLRPPSPQLMQALERIPRPVLVYDLAQIEENFFTFLEARTDVEVHY